MTIPFGHINKDAAKTVPPGLIDKPGFINEKWGWTVPPDLDKWLSQHPAISDFIVWEYPDTAVALSLPFRWKDWNSGLKHMLHETFEKAWNAELSTDPAPYPNLVKPPMGDNPMTVLHEDVARQHYLETIAVCLTSEMTSPKSWSISKLKEPQRKFLLDSRSLFSWSTDAGAAGYQVQGWVLPSRPGYMRSVLDQEGILNKTSSKATIVELIRWCGTLYHYQGPPNTSEFEKFWHYRGYVPVSRVVEGTIVTPSPDFDIPHPGAVRYTAGCFGTTGVMSHLLRMVNIPVEESYVCDHTLPHFSSINCWLSHGDDPYHLKWYPDVDPAKLLLDAKTFEAWFGKAVKNPCANVGRGSTEAGIDKVPYPLS